MSGGLLSKHRFRLTASRRANAVGELIITGHTKQILPPEVIEILIRSKPTEVRVNRRGFFDWRVVWMKKLPQEER